MSETKYPNQSTVGCATLNAVGQPEKNRVLSKFRFVLKIDLIIFLCEAFVMMRGLRQTEIVVEKQL